MNRFIKFWLDGKTWIETMWLTTMIAVVIFVSAWSIIGIVNIVDTVHKPEGIPFGQHQYGGIWYDGMEAYWIK